MNLQLGCTYYPFLVTEMGTWLRATKQGMLPQQVPLVQQMICLGWLLFTAAEYNLSEFARKIQHKTGAQVAMQFCTINNGALEHTACTTLRIKVIHLEVDQALLSSQYNTIANLYSSKAMTLVSTRNQNVPHDRASLGEYNDSKNQSCTAPNSPGALPALAHTETQWLLTIPI